MTTNTIRQALLGSAKVDKAAAKTTKTAVTQYRTEKEGRLADSTKKHAAKSTYKKNKEKAENVESEIKQKILKSDIKHINAHDYTISGLPSLETFTETLLISISARYTATRCSPIVLWA